jgi:hypothetical protein
VFQDRLIGLRLELIRNLPVCLEANPALGVQPRLWHWLAGLLRTGRWGLSGALSHAVQDRARIGNASAPKVVGLSDADPERRPAVVL